MGQTSSNLQHALALPKGGGAIKGIGKTFQANPFMGTGSFSLEYRHKHAGDLAQARERLGWIAREIVQTPWSADFADELEHKTIPQLHDELKPAKSSWGSWLKGAGLVAGGAATVLSLTATPLLPVAAAIGVLGIVKDVGLPGLELAHDWKQGKQDAGVNGLHYFIKLKG